MLRCLCLQSQKAAMLFARRQSITVRTLFQKHPRHASHNLLHSTHNYSTSPQEPLSPAAYETVCEETLESLCSALEEVLEAMAAEPGVDVELSSGVLTLKLGKAGTYVINKQTPNRQIWLSSPVSGPKRYDFAGDGWVYRHEPLRLHQLLSSELSALLGITVDLDACSHAGR